MPPPPPPPQFIDMADVDADPSPAGSVSPSAHLAPTPTARPAISAAAIRGMPVPATARGAIAPNITTPPRTAAPPEAKAPSDGNHRAFGGEIDLSAAEDVSLELSGNGPFAEGSPSGNPSTVRGREGETEIVVGDDLEVIIFTEEGSPPPPRHIPGRPKTLPPGGVEPKLDPKAEAKIETRIENEVERRLNERIQEITTEREAHLEAAHAREMGNLHEENERVRQALHAMQDKMLRTAADLDNFRKRVAKERQELMRYGHEGMARDMLQVYDNLDRALRHGLALVQTADGRPPDPAAIAQSAQSLIEGVRLCLAQFGQTLQRHGVQQFQSVGEPFDPTLHQAADVRVTDELPPDYVAAEMQSGFTIHDRLLRPAMVVVSKPSRKPAPPPEQDVSVDGVDATATDTPPSAPEPGSANDEMPPPEN